MGLVQGASAGAAVAVLLLVAGVDREIDALIIQRRPAQADVAGARVLLVELAERRVGGITQVVALTEFPPQVQPQLAIDQRPAQIETGLALVAVQATVAEGGVAAERALPLIGGGAGDHVDHAAQGFGAVQRGHRPADDFDPLDGLGGHPAQFEIRVGDAGRRGVDTLAIDQHQGLFGVHAANGDAAARQPEVFQINADGIAHGVGQVIDRSAAQLIAGNHANAGRYIGGVALGGGGGDYQAGEGGGGAAGVLGPTVAAGQGKREERPGGYLGVVFHNGDSRLRMSRLQPEACLSCVAECF